MGRALAPADSNVEKVAPLLIPDNLPEPLAVPQVASVVPVPGPVLGPTRSLKARYQ